VVDLAARDVASALQARDWARVFDGGHEHHTQPPAPAEVTAVDLVLLYAALAVAVVTAALAALRRWADHHREA